MSADVYFVQRGECGPVKIGSATDVSRRVVALQTATPERLRVIARLPGAGTAGERELHRRFAHRRLRGEWFAPSDEILAFTARCRALFRRRVIDVPQVDDWGRRFTAATAADELTWLQLAADIADQQAAVVMYRDNILVATRLLELRDLAPDAATPADAATRLGTTVDAWLLSAAS